jgi:hypothetical protein
MQISNAMPARRWASANIHRAQIFTACRGSEFIISNRDCGFLRMRDDNSFLNQERSKPILTGNRRRFALADAIHKGADRAGKS